MSRRKNQKTKILRILDVIRAADDPSKPLTIKQLCELMDEEGIPCDRRTLSDDIDTLIDYVTDNPDYNYQIAKVKGPRGYSVYSIHKIINEEPFSVEQLRQLISAVNSLHLIESVSESESRALKQKLVSLAPPEAYRKLLEYAEDENNYPLDTAAAKLLIDSINTMSFIRYNNSERIIDTLIKLSDAEDRSALADEKDNPVFLSHSSSGISVYEIDRLFRAIKTRTKVSFRYYDLNENHERIYRHGGEVYIAEPMMLLPNDGHYYLICYDPGIESSIRTYRIDKMSDIIGMTDDPISEGAMALSSELPIFTGQIFRMYNGPLCKVTLRFRNKLIGHIYDKFGADTKIKRIDDDTCQVTESIRISPPFWGWLFQFSDLMEIVSPQELACEFEEKCMSVYKYYETQ